MAWFDIVGGLAGGLQQGLSQLQQAQQAKKVEARQQALLEIQQAQERRAGEAAQRQIAEENENKFLKLLSMQDPLNIDKNFAAAYPDYAKNYFAVNPQTGNVALRMDPVKMADLQDKVQKSGQRTQFRAEFTTPEFQALPPDERMRRGLAAVAAGMDQREVLSGIGPLPADKNRSFLTSIISADKAAEILAEDERARQARNTQVTTAKISASRPTGAGTQLEDVVGRATTAISTLSSRIRTDKEQLTKLFGSTPAIKAQRQALQKKIDEDQQQLDQYTAIQRTGLERLGAAFGIAPTAPASAAQADLVWDPATKTFQKVGG